MAKDYSECITGHGANKNAPGSAKKRGENKGIAKAEKERRRREAETRQRRYEAGR